MSSVIHELFFRHYSFNKYHQKSSGKVYFLRLSYKEAMKIIITDLKLRINIIYEYELG